MGVHRCRLNRGRLRGLLDVRAELPRNRAYSDGSVAEVERGCVVEVNTPIKATKRQMAGSVIAEARNTIARKAAGLPTKVSKEVFKARIAVCFSCESYRRDGRCAECGCFMRVKAKRIDAECDKQKWD